MEVQDSAGHVVDAIRLPTNSLAAAATPIADVSPIRKGTLHELLTEAIPTCANNPQNLDLLRSSSSTANNTDSIQNVAAASSNNNLKERSLPLAFDPDKPSAMDVSPVADPDAKNKLTEKASVPCVEDKKNLAVVSTSIVNRFQTNGFQTRPLHGGHQELGKAGSAFHSVGGNVSDASSYRNLRDRSNRRLRICCVLIIRLRHITDRLMDTVGVQDLNPARGVGNVSLAQIQALGLFRYLPPFVPRGMMSPTHPVASPLDLSKSGYESVVRRAGQSLELGGQSTGHIRNGTDGTEPDVHDTHVDRMTSSPQLGSPSVHDTQRKPIQERPRQKRQTLQDMTRPLKVWLYHHRDNPYPSKSEKVQLTKSSQMTMTQVSNWFANARRRLKNTVRDPELTWAKRIKLYNNYVEGNQELLSVGSSSTSSSSDDDLRDDQTEQDADHKVDRETQSPSAQCIQEQKGGRDHLTGISNNSALADQGIKQGDNLRDRLSGETHSVTQFHSLSMHEHMNSPCNVEPMDQTPQIQSTVDSQNGSSNSQVQHQHITAQQSDTAKQSQPVHQPVSTISGFGEVEPSLDCSETAPKYKTNIMQRYLNDSYQSALHSLNSLGNRDLKESERHRNPSGSLSSHDYEEYMSSASSARSTPTREHQDGHVDEYEEFSRFWPDIKSRAEDDLYWKEISAALALTSLARSRYSTQSH